MHWPSQQKKFSKEYLIGIFVYLFIYLAIYLCNTKPGMDFDGVIV